MSNEQDFITLNKTKLPNQDILSNINEHVIPLLNELSERISKVERNVLTMNIDYQEQTKKIESMLNLIRDYLSL